MSLKSKNVSLAENLVCQRNRVFSYAKMIIMQTEIQQFNSIKKAGKLHPKLKKRLLMLGGIAIVATGIAVYDMLFKGLGALPVIGYACFGFILGFFLFNKINKITWDENEEIIKLGKFDIATFVILLIYIAYRISIHYYLANHFDDAISVSGYSLGTLVGGIIGRLLGMVWTVNRVHREITNNN